MTTDDAKGLENQENLTENLTKNNNFSEESNNITQNQVEELPKNQEIKSPESDLTKPQSENPIIRSDDFLIVNDIKNEQDEMLEKDNADNSDDKYSQLNNDEIIEKLRNLIYETNVDENRKEIEQLKSLFYKNLKQSQDSLRQEIKNSTGNEIGLGIPKDPNEEYLKELWAEYGKKKAELLKLQEEERVENLKRKEEIIEKIKVLANGEESMNKTFNEFKALQQEWLNIGQVPSSDAKGLWNNYQLQIERFYDFVKINKELRDLDFKRNLEQKIEFCEKAEELLLLTDAIEASKQLQELHELWKELGPVPSDKRVEIWERFSEVSKKIRKNYQDHFEKLKEEREANYKQKIILCEKTENILADTIPSNGNEWALLSEQVLEFQRIWKTIGMVPNAVNNEVYDRFRVACNKFFEAKTEFFNGINKELKENLQKKVELCINAESLKDSTDWKKTTELFLDLQKKWKEIGAIPKKSSDQVWKRFRAACDHFFTAKSAFYSNIEEEHKINLEKKEVLIAEINKYLPVENQSENVNKVKEFQNSWTGIGYVSNSHKDRLYNDYKEAINNLYKKLNINKSSIEISNFNTKVEAIKESGAANELTKERNRILQKIKELNTEILQIENNMGFFASGSESLIMDFNKKIEKAQTEIKTLKEKKKAVDLAERELNKKNENNAKDN